MAPMRPLPAPAAQAIARWALHRGIAPTRGVATLTTTTTTTLPIPTTTTTTTAAATPLWASAGRMTIGVDAAGVTEGSSVAKTETASTIAIPASPIEKSAAGVRASVIATG